MLAVVDDAPAAAAALPPPNDGDLVTVGRRELSCVGLDWAGPPAEPDGPGLRRFDELIRALMGACTVLPFRFWAVAEHPAAVDRWLTDRADRLAALMKRVEGRVELAVRASVGAPAGDGGTGSGRNYLEQVRRRHAGHPALVEMHATLAGGADGARVLGLDGSHLTAAYLVEAGRAAGFGHTVDATAGAHPEIRSRSVTGPWAPYSFADLPGAPVADGGWGHG